MSMKSALTSAAVVALGALGALSLTACQPGTTGGSAGSSPSAVASSPAVGASGVPVSAPSSPASSQGGGTGGTGGTGGGGSGGGDATSDSYAYQHPCAPQQLTVHVVRRSAAPSQRVIEVRNNGSASCGLSYFPLVYLDSAHAADGSQAVKPLVPSGLGGAPAYP
ncbi:hypothetical protein DN069_36715, partial [Streptacidiphilus pinicola]